MIPGCDSGSASLSLRRAVYTLRLPAVDLLPVPPCPSGFAGVDPVAAALLGVADPFFAAAGVILGVGWGAAFFAEAAAGVLAAAC